MCNEAIYLREGSGSRPTPHALPAMGVCCCELGKKQTQLQRQKARIVEQKKVTASWDRVE